MRVKHWLIGALALAGTLFPAAGADTAASPNLRIRAAEGGEFHFDTGVLRGVLRAKGRSVGLSSVIHIPSGKTISQGYGLFSHYRLLSSKQRYGPAAWDAPSEPVLRDDGSLEVRWPAAEGRPFEMRVRYRWSGPAAFDVDTWITPQADLAGFESFLASYFDAAFTNAMAYVKRPDGKPGLMAAEASNGAWQMFPRDRSVIKVIQDGRWTIPPNPVDWSILPLLDRPLAIRRDPQSGLTAILMAPADDCFAVASPQQSDRHYSIYLSLFGRTIKAGETAHARARLVVAAAPSEAEVVAFHRAYQRDLRRLRK